MATCLSRSSATPAEHVLTLRNTLRASDIDAVAALVARTGVFNGHEIEVARSLVEETLQRGERASGYRFLMLDGDSGLDAYVCFGPIPGTYTRFDLYWIAVDPAASRRGLGRALLQACERAIVAEGGTHLFIETSTTADYVPAHRLYEACGYTRHATVPDYHADGDGMAIYGKKLA